MAKNSSSSSRAHAVLGGSHKSKSKSGKKPHHISIRHGKSGGHIVTHHFEPDEDGMAQPSEDHVMPDKASLMDHIDQNVPDNPAPMSPPPDASAAAGPGAGAPPAAAPPAM